MNKKKHHRGLSPATRSAFEPLEARQLLAATIYDSGNGSSSVAGPQIVGVTSHGVVYLADKVGTTTPDLWLASAPDDAPVLLKQDVGSLRSVTKLDSKLFFSISNSLLYSNDAGSTIYVTDGTDEGTLQH